MRPLWKRKVLGLCTPHRAAPLSSSNVSVSAELVVRSERQDPEGGWEQTRLILSCDLLSPHHSSNCYYQLPGVGLIEERE